MSDIAATPPAAPEIDIAAATTPPNFTTDWSHPLAHGIVAALQTVYDPEIPVNVYLMGLIYTLEVFGDGIVTINMTLTSPTCPVAEEMPAMIREAVEKVEGVNEVTVSIVWEPSWEPSMMTEIARMELGMF